MFLWSVLVYALISLAVHFLFLGSVISFSQPQEKTSYQRVKLKVTVAEVKQEPKVVESPAPPAPPAPPPKPKEIKDAKIAKKKDLTQAQVVRKQDIPQQLATETPIQGLSKDSFAPGAGGFAAPAGNTTMAKDEGKRLRPEDVQQLKQDLSAPAKLVLESVMPPEYTLAAIDAGIEGVYKVEVYIDEEGRVTKAELTKRVGFQMDDRLLDSARNTKWLPRKDELGRSIAGWTSFTFTLKLP